MKKIKINSFVLTKLDLRNVNYLNKPTKFYFKIGYCFRIFYFLIFKKKRKVFSFLGFCIGINFNTKNFCLANTWGNQFLKITFPLICPFILSLHKNNKYNYLNFRVKKFYFKNKIKIKDLTPILFKNVFYYNIIFLLLNKPVFSTLLFKRRRKHFKKLKKKFRY